MSTTRTIPTLLAAAGLLIAPGTLHASTLVVSNIGSGNPLTHPVRLADGAPMLAGSRCLLGAFPGMTTAQIENAFQSGGLDALLANFVQVGDAFAIGEGDSDRSGHFEVSRLEPLKPSSPAAAAAGEIPHLIVLNTPGTPNANQALVLSFTATLFQQDVEIGFGSYLAVHLRDATAVVGNTHPAGGFTATAIPGRAGTDYNSWVALAFDAGTPAADSLPLADPDHDGLNNLTEFALGLDPATGDSSSDPVIPTISGNGLGIEFDLRINAPGLVTIVETSETLEEGSWLVSGSPIAYADLSSSQTAGVERVRVEIPSREAPAAFARLRFQLTPNE